MALRDWLRDAVDGVLLRILLGVDPRYARFGIGAEERAARSRNPLVVHALVRALHHYEEAIVEGAARALGTRGNPRAIGALVAALARARHTRVLETLEEALDEIDRDWKESEAALRFASRLEGNLEHHSPWVRKNAARSLGSLRGGSATESLLIALRDEDPDVREEAASALGRRGDASAAGPLGDALKRDRHPGVRACAAEALGRLGPLSEVIAWLVAALLDEEPGVQRAVRRALQELGPSWTDSGPARAAVPTFLAALRHDNPDIRDSAATALGAIKGPEAAAGLLGLLGEERDARVIGTAIFALDDLDPSWRSTDACAAAVSALMAALQHYDSLEQCRAADLLKALGPTAREANPALAALLDHPDSEVRGRAADALKRIGTGDIVEEHEARVRLAASTCPRCHEDLSASRASSEVEGRVCSSCGWAAIWCYDCGMEPMMATLAEPQLVWLECRKCGHLGRADDEVMTWLRTHDAMDA
jgi:HEAT repeat protein